jgi:hypothetical protein
MASSPQFPWVMAARIFFLIGYFKFRARGRDHKYLTSFIIFRIVLNGRDLGKHLFFDFNPVFQGIAAGILPPAPRQANLRIG